MICLEKITGWEADDALGKELTEVFRITNERIKYEVENPFTRVVREGVVVGLANHTIMFFSDFTERKKAISSPLPVPLSIQYRT